MTLSSVRFLEPVWLALLLLPPVAVLVRRLLVEGAAVRFTGTDFLDDLLERQRRRWLASTLAVLGAVLLLLPLSEPRLPAVTSTARANVMLVMDVSGSMSATDVQPTRLDVAKSAASDFVVNLPDEWRAGIVAFSERAFLLSAPTDDREALLGSLSSLLAQGGTSTGDALDLAIDAGRAGGQDRFNEAVLERDDFDGASSTVVVLLSDGAQTSGNVDALTSAERASRLGIPVHAIALGTDAGVIDIMYPDGQVRPLEVPPDFQSSARIAQATGGEFFTAVTERELAAVYESVTAVLENEEGLRDPTPLILGIGLLSLILSVLASLRRGVR